MLLRIKEGNGNPTQTLMGAIQRRNAGVSMDKDEEFHLAFLDEDVSKT